MPIDLNHLEALANAATRGPWRLTEQGFGQPGVPTVYATEDELQYIARCRNLPSHVMHAPTSDVAYARFIAAARKAVPTLIADDRRLRA